MPSSRMFFGILPWYSVLVTSGIVVAILCCVLQEKELSLPKDTTIDLALYVIPLGVIGARLYYVVVSWDTFSGDLLSILKVWNGGLAIYGGVIGGALACVLFSKRRKVPLLTLCDLIVPGLALAQAIGRWGNFFNMEAYGLPIAEPALQFFPLAVQIPVSGGTEWHMATFFYESVWDLGTFLAIWTHRKRRDRVGDGLLLYMLLYGAGRFVIEGLRMDSLTGTGSLRVSQLLSAVLVFVAFLCFCRRDPRRRTAAIIVSAILCALAIAVFLTGTFPLSTLLAACFSVLALSATAIISRR